MIASGNEIELIATHSLFYYAEQSWTEIQRRHTDWFTFDG